MEKCYSVSPYVYCLNNPVKYVDPNGKDIWIYYKDENGGNQRFIFNGSNFKEAPKDHFVKDVLTSYTYNIVNGGGDNLREAARNEDLTIKLIQSENSQFVSKKDGSNHVEWNTRWGLQTSDGHTMSPATILEHEMTHAVGYNKDSKAFKERKNTTDSQYGNKEESVVITGSESKTAQANGEFPLEYIRPAHTDGTWIRTASPISNK